MASDGTTTTQQATAQQLLRLLTQIINRVGNDPINTGYSPSPPPFMPGDADRPPPPPRLICENEYSVPMIAAIKRDLAMKALFNLTSGVNTTEIEVSIIRLQT